MAYTHPNLAQASVHGNSDFPRIWTYKTNDLAADINTSGYFNPAAADLTVGDLIYAFLDADGTPEGMLFVVNGNTGTVVDVTNGLSIGTTDSD
jgi:hypothetical protein